MNEFLFTVCIAGVAVNLIRLYFVLGRVAEHHAPTHETDTVPDWWCAICDGDHNPSECPDNVGIEIFEPEVEEVPLRDPEVLLSERARYYATYFNEREANEHSHN